MVVFDRRNDGCEFFMRALNCKSLIYSVYKNAR